MSAPETDDRSPLDVRLFGGNRDDHRKNAKYIAALSPDKLLKLIAVVEAAKRYYECYAQDEAEDGDYAVKGMPGHNTGCSYEQAVDAKALRSALKELDK